MNTNQSIQQEVVTTLSCAWQALCSFNLKSLKHLALDVKTYNTTHLVQTCCCDTLPIQCLPKEYGNIATVKMETALVSYLDIYTDHECQTDFVAAHKINDSGS